MKEADVAVRAGLIYNCCSATGGPRTDRRIGRQTIPVQRPSSKALSGSVAQGPGLRNGHTLIQVPTAKRSSHSGHLGIWCSIPHDSDVQRRPHLEWNLLLVVGNSFEAYIFA